MVKKFDFITTSSPGIQLEMHSTKNSEWTEAREFHSLLFALQPNAWNSWLQVVMTHPGGIG